MGTKGQSFVQTEPLGAACHRAHPVTTLELLYELAVTPKHQGPGSLNSRELFPASGDPDGGPGSPSLADGGWRLLPVFTWSPPLCVPVPGFRLLIETVILDHGSSQRPSLPVLPNTVIFWGTEGVRTSVYKFWGVQNSVSNRY